MNDCQFIYNDFGQLIKEYQSHDGAVDTDATPKVQYVYADGSANTIRQTQLIYPNGRELTYDYGAADSIDDVASRVASLIDDDRTTHLVDYSYLGQGTFVVTDYTEPETEYTLLGTAGGDDPDTGDIYRGLDRFGRIKDSHWYHYGDSSDTDRIKYGYDRVGNRLWRENVVATAAGKAFDELYQYDQIHRLQHMDRGTLNSPHTGMTTTTFAQCWTLDETGNWGGFREDDTGDGTWDLIQAREANPVNEISGISESAGPTWVSPTYSPAGNMTLMPKPADPTESFTATYDAWNRMVKVVDTASTDTVSEYVYDGAKRRIVQVSYDEGILDETRHFYFTQPSQWQDIEERLGATPDSAAAVQQFVWGRRYIDDCVLRDRDTDNDEEFDERLYALQDANWNVDAVVDIEGAVQERFVYMAYGELSSHSDLFAKRESSDYRWEIAYSGYRLAIDTRLYVARNRWLHCHIGAWLSRDPLSVVVHTLISPASPYQYADSMPLAATDPFGLFSISLPKTVVPPLCNSTHAIVTHCLSLYGTHLTTALACIAMTRAVCTWLKCIDSVYVALTGERENAIPPICKKTRDDDSCYHCWASCKLIAECQLPESYVAFAGVLLEAGAWDPPDSLWDLLADANGQTCGASGPGGCECCCAVSTEATYGGP